MNYRVETDALGEVQVPVDKLWGPQTQRAIKHFQIGTLTMPLELIYAIAQIKKAAAYSNHACGVLSVEKRDLIATCCDEIIAGEWDDQFPLSIWQTGSGTQTNMNVNEVVAHRAEILREGHCGSTNTFLHPNDDVNRSQSTNDVFPSAMRIAAVQAVCERLLPALELLRTALLEKENAFQDIVQIGRTHLMDATPIRLGQTFSGYRSQIEHNCETIKHALEHLWELPLGGTAVGTGLNAPEGYDEQVVDYLRQALGYPFVVSTNKFEAISSHDSLQAMSGALKRLAVSLTKIANDFRLLASGPRCGLGELLLPANEPGSSIMPGKVNPTQCEALAMVCAQVMGNDTAITAGAMQGHLQLNVFMPLIAHNLLSSINLLSDAIVSFTQHCVQGTQANEARIRINLQESLMLVTALNTKIGYAQSVKIAQYAYSQNTTLKRAAVDLGLVSEEDFDRWVDPQAMCGKERK